MVLKKKALWSLMLAVALQGCAGQPARKSDEREPATAREREAPPVDGAAAASDAVADGAPGAREATIAGEPGTTGSGADEPAPSTGAGRVYLGNDQMLAPSAKAVRQVGKQGADVTLNFDQAPIADVVQALLGDLLKVNYTLDHLPKGEVTLRTQGPISQDAVLGILESALQANGASLVRDASGVYRITSQEQLRNVVPGLYRPESLPQGYGLVVVQLRYVGAAEMADILKPVSPQGALVRVDALRNLLVLGGTRAQHEGWLEIVRSFDVDYLKGMSLGVFPLEYVSVEELSESLASLLGSTPAPALPAPAKGPAQAGAPEAAPAVQMLGTAVKLLPIKRLNTLVAVSPRAHYIETVREWIERLDKPPANDLDSRLYVYPVQNGSAAHLATILGGLYGGSGASAGASARKGADSGVAPGLSPTSLSGGRSGMGSGIGAGLGSGLSGGGSGDSLAALPDTGSATAQITTQVALGDTVRVVADEQNNALLILAPRRDYRKIEAALRQLDISPVQVLIEASIIEVSLIGDLQFGLEWTFNNRLGGGRTGTGTLNLNDVGAIGAKQPGFSYAVTNPLGNIQAVLNALAQKSLLKVLSSPSLLVQDNHTASIHVGDQQPIQSSETLSSGGNITTAIEYKDTGIMLAVTPSVNAGGLVSMNIHQTVTDVGPVDNATGQRSFLQRQIKSQVTVRTGETVVMGGLMRERKSNGKSGIPVLYDLPLVGNLFGTTSEETSRTELLVMITPRVVTSEADLRAVGDELRQRMQGLRLRPGIVRSLEN